MKHALISAMLLGVLCSSGDVQGSAEDERPAFEGRWIGAPQICRGKAWSSTARAAGWKDDVESSVCRATSNDGSLIAHMHPLEGGRFVVNVALQLQKHSTVRLFMDEIGFDLADNGQSIRVAGAPDYLKFNAERREGQRWSELRIERKDETLIVALNGKEVLRFDDKGRSYEQVGLKPIVGTIEVNRFSLTGHLVKKSQEKPTSEN